MEDHFFKIGKSKFDEKLYEEAIFHYSLALDINPVHVPSLYFMAYSNCNINMQKLALPFSDKVV